MVKIDINYLKQAKKKANMNKNILSPPIKKPPLNRALQKNRMQTITNSQPQRQLVARTPQPPLFPLKASYNSVIPLNIFQTWHTKKLSPLMYNAIMNVKNINPRFSYFLFDDTDCRDFIRQHFAPDVLYSYDSLIPGAYKADLWRYCVLFIKGGIYLDIKYMPFNGFKFINLTESEHLVVDIDGHCIYNALMVCKAGNQTLLKAIRKIVDNVKNKYYGDTYLSPTGPEMLSSIISVNDPVVDLKHEANGDENNKLILYKGIPILKSYHGHIRDRIQNSKKEHYSVLWKNRNIYE
jgi:mannosyltransferase OCH1-like enzyme